MPISSSNPHEQVETMSETVDYKTELERAYRALRGLYGAVAKGEMPDKTALAYHSPTLAAAARFVHEGALDGSGYFIGKNVSVLHDALAHYRPAPTPNHVREE
jgi:hypothetical protein